MELIYKLGLAALFIFACSLTIAVTYSQTTDEPCKSLEASQFDFWVGSWQGGWVDTEGKEQFAENIITKGINGCVIEENFTFEDKSFFGKSLSMYNVNKKLWEQTWVDNNGSYMNFTGGINGSNMVMQRNVITKTGKEIIQRMVFTDITKDSFTWNWESSSDNGATWKLVWKILYTRKH